MNPGPIKHLDLVENHQFFIRPVVLQKPLCHTSFALERPLECMRQLQRTNIRTIRNTIILFLKVRGTHCSNARVIDCFEAGVIDCLEAGVNRNTINTLLVPSLQTFLNQI